MARERACVWRESTCECLLACRQQKNALRVSHTPAVSFQGPGSAFVLQSRCLPGDVTHSGGERSCELVTIGS